MNRKERRAAGKGGGRLARQHAASAVPQDADIDELFAAAVKHDRAGELAEAQQLLRTILACDPKHVPSLVLLGSAAQLAGRNQAAIKILREALAIDDRDATAHDAIAVAYQALGRRDDAVRHFTQAIACGLGDVEQLVKQLPAIGACLGRLRSAWPRRLTLEELLGGDGLRVMAEEALLVSLLRSRPVRDLELEGFFTALRFALLQLATAEATPSMAGNAFDLCCALAQQCFINEYVFAVGDAELDSAKALRQRVAAQIHAGAEVQPFHPTVVGSYFPLHTLSAPLTSQPWPQAMEGIITQQVREPQSEAQDRNAIPTLTPIEDHVSLEVQRQYEENPYPRWTLAPRVKPTTMREYLRKELPFASLRWLPEANDFDLLIAGCGTGEHAVERALRFPGARLLAVDLSRASLAYARRKTREAGLDNIEYGQADILALGSIGRSFDVIEAVGVLHHLSEPIAGWQVLLSLLRPNGLMAVGLYSATARRPYTALRTAIAERGFRANAADIRACRQDLISRGEQPHKNDFYTMSGCRDFLFNVIEHQFTLPQIKALLNDSELTFLGFELSKDTVQQFRQQYSDPGAMVDLDCWHAFELAHPHTFAAMYVFWVQKTRC